MTLEIDILKHEVDNDLPYWLSPAEKRTSPEDIRAKHRKRWLAAQKLKRAQLADYDPNEARDKYGRWSAEGAIPARQPWQAKVTPEEFDQLAEQARQDVFKERPRLHKSYKTQIAETLGALAASAKSKADWSNWYDQHRPLAKALFGKDEPLFEKLLGATSLQMAPGPNLRMALHAYEWHKQGKDMEDFHAIASVRSELKKAVAGELAGPKTNPYSKALRGDWSQIALDRHMFAAIFKGMSNTKKPRDPNLAQFEIGKRVITAFAKRVGWTPAEFQAVLWATQKATHEKGLQAEVKSYREYLLDEAEGLQKFFAKHHELKPEGSMLDAVAMAKPEMSLVEEQEAYLNAAMLLGFIMKLRERSR